MDYEKTLAIVAACMLLSLAAVRLSHAGMDGPVTLPKKGAEEAAKVKSMNVQLGPRPFFLIDDMDESVLSVSPKTPFFRQ
ncbi:MAG: hypothetical protein KIT59_08335 [Nitrosomonas sp.]|nr:hypothetical protein [Nitrosomonas sp.]